jgi:hypothetical protein
MMKLHFLSAADASYTAVALTKRFTQGPNGLEKEPYPLVKRVSSIEETVGTIDDFYTALCAHAAQGHCLLKGKLDRALRNESRAGHTDADEPTQWLVLDNDGLHDMEPSELLTQLGLADVHHIVQYSASAGIEPGKRGYHLFLLLDQAHRPADLKRMLKPWNLSIPALSAKLGLTRTDSALRWPLDIGVCQNDKLIYIAPPVLGPGVTDGLQGERIRLVQGTRRVATLTLPDQHDEGLRQTELAPINRLRKTAGLSARAFETRKLGTVQVLRDVDQAEVTGRKEERGFVYLNLNGGDSWGYYHPAESAEVLFNFKGEPNYAIAELLPDYYPEALARAQEAQAERTVARQREDMLAQAKALQDAEATGEPVLLAARDQETDQYLAGWLDPKAGSHALYAIGNKGKINDLFAQHGRPKPEVIPTVSVRFEPANDALYDTSLTFINRFIPSRFWKEARQRDDAELPPDIARVIGHALGGDAALVEHFLNWLAVLFRYRCHTGSAWILQGTTGTGKGMLFNDIIRPLIGEAYCRAVGLGNLEEQFNGFAAETIELFVDEVDTDQVRQMPKLIARLKRWITEPRIELRAMRQDLRNLDNHLNLILASNQPNSMRIEANDRRYTVCPRQEAKLLAPGEDGAELAQRIAKELPALADYLRSRPADRSLAGSALDTPAKRLLQAITQTAIEEVAHAFRYGDLAYFVEQRPLGGDTVPRTTPFDGRQVYPRGAYRDFLDEALTAAAAGDKHVVAHEHLFAVFELQVGGMPSSKAKLSKRLGHQGMQINPHTRGGTSQRGFGVQWQAEPGQIDAWCTQLEAEAEPGFTQGPAPDEPPTVRRPLRASEPEDAA